MSYPKLSLAFITLCCLLLGLLCCILYGNCTGHEPKARPLTDRQTDRQTDCFLHGRGVGVVVSTCQVTG